MTKKDGTKSPGAVMDAGSAPGEGAGLVVLNLINESPSWISAVENHLSDVAQASGPVALSVLDNSPGANFPNFVSQLGGAGALLVGVEAEDGVAGSQALLQLDAIRRVAGDTADGMAIWVYNRDKPGSPDEDTENGFTTRIRELFGVEGDEGPGLGLVTESLGGVAVWAADQVGLAEQQASIAIYNLVKSIDDGLADVYPLDQADQILGELDKIKQERAQKFVEIYVPKFRRLMKQSPSSSSWKLRRKLRERRGVGVTPWEQQDKALVGVALEKSLKEEGFSLVVDDVDNTGEHITLFRPGAEKCIDSRSHRVFTGSAYTSRRERRRQRREKNRVTRRIERDGREGERQRNAAIRKHMDSRFP
jgi:hypothetical protein